MSKGFDGVHLSRTVDAGQGHRARLSFIAGPLTPKRAWGIFGESIRRPFGSRRWALGKGQAGVAMPDVTIAEVASHAGVSPSTVSYVLNGNPKISDHTRERVRASIKALNYRPHAGARALRSGRTDVVALAIPMYEWTNERVVMPFVYGVVEAARRHGWNVMLLTDAEHGAEIDQVVRSKMVDGVVLMEVREDDERVAALSGLEARAVTLGMPLQGSSMPYVDFDFEACGRASVDYLVELGHTQIGLLAAPSGVFNRKLGYAQRLWQGVSERLRELGLDFHGCPMEPTMDGVLDALDGLYKKVPGLTAVVVHNEGSLDTLLQALKQRDKDVPSDLSVLAVCQRDLALRVSPVLTCMDVPAVEMGRGAVELLHAREPTSYLVAPVLVPGASTGPPRSRGRVREALTTRRADKPVGPVRAT